MAAKKLKPAKKRSATPTSKKKARAKKASTRPKQTTRTSTAPLKRPSGQAAAVESRADSEPMPPPVLPTPSATFIF